MGIHPYGLFGTYESNNPFGADYEVRHQLDARKSQLDALSKKEKLTEDEEAKKEQLNKAITTLQSRLGEGVIYSKSSASTPSSISKTSEANNPAIQNHEEGKVIPKSTYSVPGKNSSSDPNSYLKGFFVDLKI